MTTPELVPTADVVVIHRVVCCYPDADALVGAAADRASRDLVLSFPRDSWWNRLGFRTLDAVLSFLSGGFRTFVRPAETVLHAAHVRGFVTQLDESATVWRLAALTGRR